MAANRLALFQTRGFINKTTSSLRSPDENPLWHFSAYGFKMAAISAIYLCLTEKALGSRSREIPLARRPSCVELLFIGTVPVDTLSSPCY